MLDSTTHQLTRRSFHALSRCSLSAPITLAVLLLSVSPQAAAGEGNMGAESTGIEETDAKAARLEKTGNESPTAQADAKARYELGVEAYRAHRFEDAIELFLSADALAPRPALAFNVARAYEKLREPARALQYYREYLRRGANGNNREQVARRVRKLQTALARQGLQQVTVRSQPSGAAVSIDGKFRGTTPWTGELSIGTHQLQAQQRDRDSVSVALTLDASRAQNLELVLPAAARAPGPTEAELAASHRAVGQGANISDTSEAREGGSLQPWPWVAFGAGGAALVAAGAFELLRRSAESDAQDARYQPDYYDDHDRMRSHQTTARVLLGVSAVLLLSGGVLALISGTEPNTEPAPIALGCTTTTCLGTWMGSF